MLLKRLGVPQKLWADFLLCEVLTMPGWIAWTRYQQRDAEQHGEENTDFAGLLAMRLTYEVALSEHLAFHVHWPSIAVHHSSLVDEVGLKKDEDLLRYALLKASEIAFRKRLVADLASSQNDVDPASAKDRSLAQMVFCIDVRSERIRRHLEASSHAIETFGFAGFFGLPIEFVGLGETEGSSQVPVLLAPSSKSTKNLTRPMQRKHTPRGTNGQPFGSYAIRGRAFNRRERVPLLSSKPRGCCTA